MTTDDRDPSPILSLARELCDLLVDERDGFNMAAAVIRARQMAEELCDAIEADEAHVPTDEEIADTRKRHGEIKQQRRMAALRRDFDWAMGRTHAPDDDRLLAESEAAARAADLIECDDDLKPENESR